MGTARSASMEVMITIGRTSTASVAPPARMLRPVPTPSDWNRATNTDSPSRP